ncbi:uncharacterized protein LOC133488413 isoform X1 [Phyllopteryx taeniolatus]|uniref:uncharacterized protein LOC133488413 isoform X1 n=2 Tax=Phyllopteryx taeniolatus TaxID=161469 RepID=UPI002AD29139|nr:uncharacterized protein LOC133488413 isoform X1 [Phyllopteryx taeniolatus]
MSSPFMTAPTHAGCEPPEIRTPDGTEYESRCFKSYRKSKQVKVFCQSQVVYSLNCSVTMNTRCSSKLKTASEKKLDKSPNASEDAVQRQTRAKRRRRRTEFDDGSINKEDGRIHNIIHIINSHVEEEPEAGSIAQVVERGSDYLDEECRSTTAPSPLKVTAPNKKLRPPAGLCSSCRKFYQRAKRLKTPIKDKLLDNDPTSLTCDQWVLLKKWNPSRLPHSSGKLSHCVLLLHTRLKGKNQAKQNKQDGHKHSCSRPHLFLQRNLWKPCKVPARKERKRKQGKRPRDDSQGFQIGKQKRLRGKTSPQDNIGNWTNQSSFYSACAGLDVEGFHSGESADENNSNVSANIIPCTFTMQTTKLEGNPPKQKAPMKKTSEFQDLLAQLRGNSSVIVKETQ